MKSRSIFATTWFSGLLKSISKQLKGAFNHTSKKAKATLQEAVDAAFSSEYGKMEKDGYWSYKFKLNDDALKEIKQVAVSEMSNIIRSGTQSIIEQFKSTYTPAYFEAIIQKRIDSHIDAIITNGVQKRITEIMAEVAAKNQGK